jgi:hypothetical protein
MVPEQQPRVPLSENARVCKPIVLPDGQDILIRDGSQIGQVLSSLCSSSREEPIFRDVLARLIYPEEVPIFIARPNLSVKITELNRKLARCGRKIVYLKLTDRRRVSESEIAYYLAPIETGTP